MMLFYTYEFHEIKRIPQIYIPEMLKEEMDVLMLLFAESEPDFYNAYKNARMILDYTERGKANPEVAVPD